MAGQLVSEPGFALAASAIDSNGVTVKGGDDYLVSGKDAYFLLPFTEAERTTTVPANELHLSVSITQPGDEKLAIPAELFFKPEVSEGKWVFDPLYRIQFVLPAANFSHIVLPVPDQINFSGQQLARFDIDKCHGCTVHLGSGFELKARGSIANPDATVVINPGRIFNGMLALPDSGQLIDSQNWRMHDLILSEGKIEVSGGDPFLVSPVLDIDTSNLGGVMFDLDVPVADLPIYDFQLFYSTEQHEFIERASSIMRVIGEAELIENDKRLQFFIPLDFLSNQTPAVQMLKTAAAGSCTA